MGEPLPRVSVVVPVRDDLDGLRRCLAALERQTYPHDRIEVVVADSASHDPVRPAPTSGPAVRVVRVDAPGSYLARNRALEAADGEVVAFTDADCEPASDWVAAGVAALDGADVVAGDVEVVPRGGRRTSVELFELMFAFPQDHYVRERGFGVTANLFVRRRVLDHVGGFDATLRSAGDSEWGRRATAAGWSLVHDPTVRVRHPARRTWRQLVTKRRRTMEGTLALQASGRLDWTPGLRMYLFPDRAKLARIRHEGQFGPSERVRIALAVAVEDLTAAWVLARSRRRARR